MPALSSYRFPRTLLLGLATVLLVACSAPAPSSNTPSPPAGAATATKKPIPEGYIRYISQPNGWGATPEAAIRDLRQRILPWYQKNYGDRPGFEIDWDWCALVEVADGRLWQADGRLWWYVPPVVKPSGGPR